MMLRAIILACVFFVGAQARIAFLACPTVTPKTGVTYNQLVGSWFEYGGYFDLSRVGTDCTTYLMTLQAVDTELEIETTVRNTQSGETSSSTTSYTVGTSTDGILRPSEGQNLILLETDYTNYAVFYTCEDLFFNLIRRDFLWVLIRRETGLDVPSFVGVRDTLAANGLNYPLFRTSQENCGED